MADNILLKLLLEGGDEAKRILDSIGRSGKKSLDDLSNAGDKGAQGLNKVDTAIRRVNTSFTTVQGPLQKVGGSLGDLGTAFVSLGRNIGVASLAIAGVTAVLAPVGIGLFALAKSASDTVESLRDAAIAAGTTSENFAKLGFAAEQSGSSADSMSRALTVITDATGDAIEAGKRSSGVFEKFGINLVDASGHARDAGAIFEDIAEKISKIKNPADQAAAAAQLFGRRIGPGLVQLLSQGRKGIQALGKDAEDLGIAFNKAQTEVGDDFNDALNRVVQSITGLKVAFGLPFAQTFTSSINALANALKGLNPFFKELGKSLSTQLKAGFDLIGAALAKLAPVFQKVGEGAKFLLDSFNELFGTALSGADIAAFVTIFIGLGVAMAGVLVIVGGFSVAFGGLVSLLSSGLGVFTAFAGVIRALFGAFFGVASGARLLIAALNPTTLVILAIVAAIALLVYGLSQVDWESVGESARDTWNSIVRFITDAKDTAVKNWQAAVDFFSGIWDTIADAASGVWDTIANAVQAAVTRIDGMWEGLKTTISAVWTSITQQIQSAVDRIVSLIQRAIQFMEDLIRKAQEAIRAAAAAASAGSGSASGGPMRSGGGVSGPGTSTSDSIPALLSRGEWVIRAAAVRKYGSQIFHALNSMRLPANVIRDLIGRSQGGPAFDFSSLARQFAGTPLRFAEGGSVKEAMEKFSLVIGGQSFEGLLAPTTVAEKLIQFALSEQVRSGGRKPSWYLS